MTASTYLLIALGGALGSMARFAIANLGAAAFGVAFPYGTLIVNVAGSFLIGLFAMWTAPMDGAPFGPLTQQFVMTGICGGFTTFSSFSLQTLILMREGQWGAAGVNVAGSVALCLAAAWLGMLAAAALLRPAV